MVVDRRVTPLTGQVYMKDGQAAGFFRVSCHQWKIQTCLSCWAQCTKSNQTKTFHFKMNLRLDLATAIKIAIIEGKRRLLQGTVAMPCGPRTSLMAEKELSFERDNFRNSGT